MEGMITLRERLDAALAALEGAEYDRVRVGIFSGAWTRDVETTEVSAESIAHAVTLTDSAHAALTRWPPDLVRAKESLAAARAILEG